MIAMIGIWLLVTAGVGYLASLVFWPGPTRWRSAEGLLRASLAIGLGFGVTSCGFFIATVLFGPRRPAAFAADAVTVVCLILLVRVRTRRAAEAPAIAEPRPRPARLDRAIGWGAVALLAVAAVTTLSYALQKPQGDWDGWGIYNLTARFIFFGGPSWHRAFTPGLGIHPDYPLLLPGTAVRGWLYTGRWTSVVPAVVSVLFAYAAVGLVAATLWLVRGRRHAALAGLALLGTPFLLTAAASQYADLSLAYYFVAAVAFHALAQRMDGEAGWLLAGSGFCAGLAAWTKNEGLLFVLVLSFVLVAAHRQLRRSAAHRRVLVTFLAGLLPVLLVIMYFKVTLAPPNDLVSGQGTSTLTRLLDPSRYWLIVRSVLRVAQRFPIVPLAIFLAIVGIHADGRVRRAAWVTAFVVAGLAAGYFAVYVTSPNDLAVQIHRSLDRLILQLWPMSVFLALLVARVPEQDGATAGS